ncbi:MAG: NADP(H)-dependent aldo-keto reductase [Pseudomonadota bacterium]
MQYRPLGNSDLEVSLIGLGTMTFGEQNSEAEGHQQLDYAVERGINFIDTAEMYPVPPVAETQGRTEAIIGTWLEKRGRRDDVIIASKASGPGDFMKHIRGGPRLTADHLERAVEDSLKRLQTDYIDLYQLHWPDRNTNFFGKLGYKPSEADETPLEESLKALKSLVEAGKIRHIGLSNETPWGLARCLHLAEQLDLPRVVSVQNPYNLVNRSYEVGLAEFAHRDQVGLLAYSPLGFGALSGKYLDGQRPEGARMTRWTRFARYFTESGIEATRAYVELAREHGLSPTQMALAFVNSRPFTTSNLIGATTMEQLESNIDSVDLNLSEEVLEGIEAIHKRWSNPCP